MTTTFYYTRDTQRGTESLVIAGQVVRTVPSSHPNFLKIRDYCFEQDRDGAEIDMEKVLSLYDAERYIGDQLLLITDRVSFRAGKLLWDGEPTEGALAAHIVRMVKNRDDNYVAFAKFLENLAQNPSQASRASLFEWISDRDFTITEDGDFVGYKGVNFDYTSKQHGYGIVNGVEVDGALDNTPGNVVAVPRNRVDPDRDSACSYGLHVGTRSYAQHWASGGKMVVVAVNPRDVVMVPRDGDGHKMRVCQYTVLADNTEELTTTTYNGAHRAEEEDAEVDFYDDRCEECDCLLEGGECPCECGDETVERCEDCGGETDPGESLCEECEEESSAGDDEDDHAAQEVATAKCLWCGSDLNEDGICSRRS